MERHNTYGGEIYLSDFNTSYEGHKGIAERIAKAERFDKQCLKNIETNLKKKEGKKNVAL